MGSVSSSKHGHDHGQSTLIDRFQPDERDMLHKLFEDLASHSAKTSKPLINKETFLRVFKQPGMLGERLFAVFDTKNDQFIDQSEFLEGLSVIVHGNQSEKIGFLFHMYDLNNDGFVSKIELSTMLNCAVGSSQFFSKQGDIESFDERNDLNHECVALEHVKELIRIAFDGNSNDLKDKMNKNQFEKFVTENIEILEILEDSFTFHDFLESDEEEEDNVVKKGVNLTHARLKYKKSYSHHNLNRIGSDTLHRHFLNEVVTPDSVKERHRISESIRPIQFICNSCSFVFSLSFCYSCGMKTSTSDCQNCGKIFNKHIFFCPACGAKLNNQQFDSYNHYNRQYRRQILNHNSNLKQKQQQQLKNKQQLKKQTQQQQQQNKQQQLKKKQQQQQNENESDLINISSSETQSNGQIIKQESQPFLSKTHFNRTESTASQPISPWEKSHTINSQKSIKNYTLSHIYENYHHAHYHHASMRGFLYKVGKRLQYPTERYFILRDSFLYTFRRYDDVKPRQTTFLEGCVVKQVNHEVQNKKMRWGFQISFPFDLTDLHTKTLYAQTKQTRDQWINSIQLGADSHDIHTFYSFEGHIGLGKFSSVHVCTHKKSGKKYAVKIIDRTKMDSREREALRTEIAVMKLVRHPNIIQIRNVYETKSVIYIVMNLVRGGDLFERIKMRKRFSEATTRHIIWKLLDVCQYLHSRGIVHRDLKPENIMIEDALHDDHILVGDFGLSKFTGPDAYMKLPCGTLAYVAPEVLRGRGYGKEVDLWSIGVIMYVLLRGALPFDSKNKQEIISKTLAGRLNFEGSIWASVSPEAKDLIRGLLAIDQTKRLTVERAMKHQWFQMVGHVSDEDSEAQNGFKENLQTQSEGGRKVLKKKDKEINGRKLFNGQNEKSCDKNNKSCEFYEGKMSEKSVRMGKKKEEENSRFEEVLNDRLNITSKVSCRRLYHVSKTISSSSTSKMAQLSV